MNFDNPVRYRSSAAVYGLMLLILIYIGRAHELIPGTERINVAKIAIGLTLMFYFASQKERGAPISSFAPIKYVIWISVLVVLSIPLSVYSGGSLDFLTLSYYKNILFLLLLVAIIEIDADLEKIALAVVLSVAALSVAVLMLVGDKRARASNTYDPNDMAFVLVSLIPIVYFMMKGKKWPAKPILMGVIVIMLLACLKTLSRGGLVGLSVVGAAIYLKQGRSIKQAIVPFILVVTVFSMFATDAYWTRMSTMLNPDKDYNMYDSTGRIEVWKRGLTMMATHPFGVGAGVYEVAEGRMHEGKGKWSSAHNSFIQIGAELGIIGLYLFIKLLQSSIMSVRDSRRRNINGVIPDWLLDGIEVAFYGYMTTGFFLSQAYSNVLFLLVAMAVCTKKIIDRDETLYALQKVKV